MLDGNTYAYTDQNLNASDNRPNGSSLSYIKQAFKSFIHNFDREGVRIYQNQFNSNAQHDRHFLSVNLEDIKSHDQQMYQMLVGNPLQSLMAMEEALGEYANEKHPNLDTYFSAKWQVMLRSDNVPRPLRDMSSNLVGKLIVVSGIIVSATKPYIKATTLKVQCKFCDSIENIQMIPGQSPIIKRKCTANPLAKCELDPFVVLPKSQVEDCQSLKIQENPEEIPTGEIPRSVTLVSDRFNVSKCIPGDRVRITGIMMIDERKNSGNSVLNVGYIYVTGVEKLKERTTANYTTQDEESFKRLAKDPLIYEKIAKSIAPGICGSDDIKKAIACMLFGGSRKRLPDNTTLRGDINILLLGDPSTAKSQFLKFVEQTAAIAVYTSGKGSSAAGLTASVTRDMASGEFQIEGGALVLADGGIVCIDEFDKMKVGDRVAIHEAMEQQTISVAKAGITTRLNSRTSVLAAANPIFGRFDDLQQIEDQTELKSTILSRFDCIFIVRDMNTAEMNERIAGHILDLHQGKSVNRQNESEFPFETLKKYISFARNKISPRLSYDAYDKLQNLYVEDRQKAKTNKSIPITVRQLEAVIRIS